MLLIFSLFVSAAVLGIIITVMEGDGEFPGWFSMIGCVLAAWIPATIINAFLPEGMFFVGLAVGALCAGIAISALCGMSVKRACIAAGIYLVIEILMSLMWGALLT